MQLVSNSTTNHLNVIKSLIKNSDEVIICVAFLKLSGLELLLDNFKKRKTKCIFYVGTDYYLTEPDAVRKLATNGHKIFRTTKGNSTFHPKIYYFSKGQKATIIVGSANMTGGGLKSNFETSLLFETTTTSSLVRKFKTEIRNFLKYSTDFTDELVISQYEFQFQKYRQKHKKAEREFKKEIAAQNIFDLHDIPKFAKEYKSEPATRDRFQNRTNQYKQVKKRIHDALRSDISTPNEFLSYYDEIAVLFHSSGLLRGKKTKAKHYKRILSIFRLVKENRNLPARELLKRLCL